MIMKNVDFNLISIPLIIMIGGIHLISCSSERKKERAADDGICTIDVDVKKTTTFDIEDVGVLVKYIPLQTKDEVLLGSIDKLYVKDDSIIVFDRENKNIFLFDQDGAFVRQIGTRGQGPDEYIEFGDIYYDSETEKLYAYERFKDEIFVYSLNGEIDEVIDSHFSFNSFIRGDDGFWLYGCFQNNPEKYQLLYVDAKLSTIKEGYFPQTAFVNLAIETCFTRDNEGNKFFYYPGSNIIYKLNKDNAAPFIFFDFGDRTLPYKEISKAKDQKEYDKIVQMTADYIGFIENVHVSGIDCILNCQESGLYISKKIFKVWFNLDNGEISVYNGYHNAPGSPSLYRLLTITSKNELVYEINPQRLMEREIEEAQKVIPSLTEDSNPVLVFYKIKQ